jgi:hypothetical protein
LVHSSVLAVALQNLAKFVGSLFKDPAGKFFSGDEALPGH